MALGPVTAPSAAEQLNKLLTDCLGSEYRIVASPAGLPNKKQYALFLQSLLATKEQKPGVWLSLDINDVEAMIRNSDLDKMWEAWVESCTEYKASQTPEALLIADIDHARRTWANYVAHEVAPKKREAMKKPTPENILIRLRQKGQADATISPDQIRGIMDLLTISSSEASFLFDVPNSSITLACREGEIEGAKKVGRDWVFKQGDFVDWMKAKN